ncbi:cell division protein ZapA [candidate division KSB1 bacterium]|nr:cell division protein ZapA [candidate division KSB1 bacterium]
MKEYNVLKVNIYGTDYPIRGNTNTEYIKKVAEYVDKKMREVDQSVAVVSTLKVAILAALNIADELFRERSEREEFTHDFEDKIRKLSLLLDENLAIDSEK